MSVVEEVLQHLAVGVEDLGLGHEADVFAFVGDGQVPGVGLAKGALPGRAEHDVAYVIKQHHPFQIPLVVHYRIEIAF